ncbi:hypothetical protein QBC46DRAFT_162063 [Diplogelasinospora grovesii]|uniref:Uncharacterized protein n=1 Tax=Diplogelasinospora grovesii TaxID=303347 RepID=A0AAN6S2Y3_9PEZI|nr:hypothetical protein QBC46DRAFT_162063 [Diplogelasinospora grovesii]
MDALKATLGNKMDQKAQPGDSVEGKADDAVNSGIDQAANSAGVPQQDDHAINDVTDSKVNSDIPGGN